jgi:branched-chain amino acid transport system substrate-binding protein
MTSIKISKRELLGVTGIALASGVSRKAWAQEREVKVGMIVPLSGPWARNGQLLRAGAEQAIDEINQAGGIKALGGAKMRLVAADAEDSPEKAKNAAQRFIAQEPDIVAGLGSYTSSFTLAVTEVTERAGLPWITTSLADQITGRGFKHVFQTSPIASVLAGQTVPAVLEIAASAGTKRPASAAIITDNSAALQASAKFLRETELPKHQIRLVSEETFTPPLSDATPLVDKLRRSRPDFIFLLPTTVSDSKLLLDKLSELGLGGGVVPTVSIGGALATPEMLKVAGATTMQGALVAFPGWPGKGQEEIEERFKKRTGEPFMTFDSFADYAHIWIFKEALEKAGAADRAKVTAAIREMDTTEGPAKLFVGGRLKFDDVGRRVNASIVVVQWQDGVPVPVVPKEVAIKQAIWGRR